MTQEEEKDFNGKFAERWKKFVTKYPSYATDFSIEVIANYFFEKGREDIMDRVWGEIMK